MMMLRTDPATPSNQSNHSQLSLTRVMSMALLFAAMSVAVPRAQGDPGPLPAAEIGSDLNADDNTDVNAAEKFGNAVQEMVYAEDFDRLEQVADSVRSSKAKFAGGLWKIHAFYSGTSATRGHATEKDWKDLHKKLTGWSSAKPQSIAARIALAYFYLNYAWDARGSGFTDTVTSDGWKLFESRTAKAKEVLDEAAKLPTKDPEWYLVMQQVALAQGWNKVQARQLLERAIAFQPDYYYYYRMYANFVLPKWYGEPGESESFAQESADRIRGEQGDIIYFRVASYLMCNCANEPQLKNMSLTRIRRGFAAAETLYGFSLTNSNLMAAMATKMAEATIADAQFKRIGESWSREAFQNQPYFEASKAWAANLGPSLRSITDDKDAGEASMQTPEGQHYDTEFKQKYASVIQMCFQSSDPALGKSDLYVQVGPDGSMVHMMAFSQNPAAACLYQLARKPLSPPSHAPFWIKLTFDPVAPHTN